VSEIVLSPAAARKAVRSSQRSRLEDLLVARIAQAGLLAPERELRFAPPRQWRFDLAWPDLRLALEVDGGIFVRGRHTRGLGQLADMEKFNRAALNGWRVLRVGRQHIVNGQALEWIREGISGAR